MIIGYISSLFLFGVAYYVWHFNQTHPDAYMLLPFLDAIPGLEGDIPAQGEWTWRITAAVGLVVLVVNIGNHLRNRARRAKNPSR